MRRQRHLTQQLVAKYAQGARERPAIVGGERGGGCGGRRRGRRGRCASRARAARCGGARRRRARACGAGRGRRRARHGRRRRRRAVAAACAGVAGAVRAAGRQGRCQKWQGKRLLRAVHRVVYALGIFAQAQLACAQGGSPAQQALVPRVRAPGVRDGGQRACRVLQKNARAQALLAPHAHEPAPQRGQQGAAPRLRDVPARRHAIGGRISGGRGLAVGNARGVRPDGKGGYRLSGGGGGVHLHGRLAVLRLRVADQ